MPQLLRDRNTATDNTATTGPVIDASDGVAPIVVEAPTAAEALEEVHRRHGTGARIVNAEKVLRGGVGGFFAKELVQLTVEVAPAPAPQPTPAPAASGVPGASSGTAPSASASGAEDPYANETFGEMLDRRAAAGVPGGGLAGVVAELTAATESRESTFGDALRAAIDRDPIASSPAPSPAAAAASERAEFLARTGTRSLLDTTPAVGAAALVGTADRRLRDHDLATPAGVERAEARLDAAVRAVQAGATASAVVRAAEAGDVTGFAPPELGATPDGPVVAATPAAHDTIADSIAALLRPAAADPATTGTTAPSSVAPSSTVPAVREPDPSMPDNPWSADALVRLGLPASLVNAITVQHPTDDLSWFAAVARAVTPLCGPLPAGAEVVVGGHARRYARAAMIDVVTLDKRAPRRASFAMTAKASERTRRWLEREQRDRWLHLVVGGASWREWLWERPAVVSWTTPDDLPTAVGAAAELDLVLGHAVSGATVRRAAPVDIAIAIRELLELR